MSLEDATIEKMSDTCQVCGAKLTASEQQTVLESGGPPLCAIHASEIVPLADEDAPADPDAA